MAKALLSTALLAGALVACGASQASAQQQQKSQVGELRCKVAPSVGLVVGSRQRMTCRYTPNNGRPEVYNGVMGRIGLDIGISAGGVLAWAVFGQTSLPRGALAGKYGGASGDIALGVGVGANALVGGSRHSVVLQPLSVEGSIGVGVALGAAGLTLTLAH